jgi:NAD(P)-dependent dehydrogenase (short-subunit alcohol dehydrogenase family)
MFASGVAYSNAKLAILYYAHELQRRAGAGIGVSVFEPGWMPGTALGRGAPAAFQAISRALGRIPGVSTPRRSGPLLAAMALDDKWAHLRDGAFVIKTKPVEVRPVAHDRDRERRLWEATTELVERADTSR